ncbi:MAG TPA: hypothetical protein VFN45_14980 [Myxococcaceae bacterium]|nr:hypothetical protein [Myxococcaceae bacterium]
MKRLPLLLGLTLATSGLVPLTAVAETPRQEKAAHPNIAHAIDALEQAIRDMQKAPHDFGGHKADAIRASEEAVRQLRAALDYRAAVDTSHGK